MSKWIVVAMTAFMLVGCESDSDKPSYCERLIAAMQDAAVAMGDCGAGYETWITVEQCNARIPEACNNPSDLNAEVAMVECGISAGNCTSETYDAWWAAEESCVDAIESTLSTACAEYRMTDH